MGGRLALVIGSECEALGPAGRLGFVDELAAGLFERLHRLGGWEPAVGAGSVLNPTVDELKTAVGHACSVASARNATLLISFLGHGVTMHKSLFLLAADSDPRAVDSDTAYNLGQGIIEKLVPACLDGLIVLVDACEAGAGVTDAFRWVEVIDPTAGRIEVLAASDNGSAYEGCFTRTMLSAFDEGLAEQGTYLLPGDLRPAIAHSCRRQTPRQFSSAVGGDPGLWLVPNVSRVKDAVFERPSAGFVDLLTRGPTIGASVLDRAAEVYAAGGYRLRMVVGPAGCGKSTVMALLIRPALLADAPFTASYVTAAVFVDVSTTVESFTAELATQLRRRAPGYAAAVEAVAARYHERDIVPDSVELELLEPLELVRPRFGQLTVIIDGLDQAETGVREQIITTIAELTTRTELAHVQLIVGVREGHGIEDIPLLSHRHLSRLTAPTDVDIVTAVQHAHPAPDHQIASRSAGVASLRAQTSAGGWLLARLLIETRDDTARDSLQLGTLVRQRIATAVSASGPGAAQSITAILGILAAAGSGPVLPLELLEHALAAMGIRANQPHIRDLVANLGVLLSRGNPGTPAESLGLAHIDFGPPIQQHLIEHHLQARDTHLALLTAIESTHTDAATQYARGSAARHHLLTGDSDTALDHLLELDTAHAADNRDRWVSWLPLFTDTLGTDHPDTLVLRGYLAHWRGESGDAAGAISELAQLLPDHVRVLGADHPDTLTTRHNIAYWRGECGDVAGAISGLEQLLPDRVRVLGADHPDTVDTRHDLIFWRGETGDVAGAISEFEQVLADSSRILGPDHPFTLATRHNIADRRGQGGDVAGAISGLEQLLADCSRILGAEHPATLATRQALARWRCENGDVASAINQFEQLLTDRVRILGPDHPDTLATRYSLARWRGDNGDVANAITQLEQLLTDSSRILGADHPDTLATRYSLAHWRGDIGDIARAISEFEQLRTDRVRILGTDHPATLATRHGLARWRGESGDVASAITALEQLCTDSSRILGPEHLATLTIRHSLAYWRAESGDVASAISEFEQLLADRLRILGADHPDTLTTRSNLATWRREGGDVAGTTGEIEQLLTDRVRILGTDHPDTLTTRGNLARCRGESGAVASAITELEQLLADRRRILGPDHPDTLTTRHNLAYWRGRSGAAAAATTEFEQLLTDRLRILGANHPDTLLTRSTLAECRGQSGDIPGAITELEQLLTDHLLVLRSPDHPDILTTRHNLACWRGESGAVASAITELEQLLPDRLRILGANHPDTLTTRHNLAYWRGRGGDVTRAITELEELLRDCSRIYGGTHPDTLSTARHLASLREQSTGHSE